MATKKAKPKTIPEYIAAAPARGRPQLQRLYELLQAAAPEAQEEIKWGTPFFVEPRFLFAFSAHKAHLGFNPSLAGIEPFRSQLTDHEVTAMGILKLPYDRPLPEALIRKIAKARVKAVSARDDDSFW